MAIASCQLLALLLLLTTTYISAASHPGGLRLGPIRRPLIQKSSLQSTEIPPEYETHYYTQTLDHFNYYPKSYGTFQQRYILNFKYWGGANTSSPIFFYAGEEADILGDVLYVNFIADLAARFKGLLLYVEVCLPSRVHEYLINLEMDEKKLHFAASLLWRIISIWIQQRNIPKWEYTWILELRTGFGRLCTGHYRC